jgi:hypothetical protein
MTDQLFKEETPEEIREHIAISATETSIRDDSVWEGQGEAFNLDTFLSKPLFHQQHGANAAGTSRQEKLKRAKWSDKRD